MPITVCKECHEVLDSTPDVDGARVDATCDECAELLRLRARVAELEAAIGRVGDILGANGCDCECGHHSEDHDDECERCMPCLIDMALGKESE